MIYNRERAFTLKFFPSSAPVLLSFWQPPTQLMWTLSDKNLIIWAWHISVPVCKVGIGKIFSSWRILCLAHEKIKTQICLRIPMSLSSVLLSQLVVSSVCDDNATYSSTLVCDNYPHLRVQCSCVPCPLQGGSKLGPPTGAVNWVDCVRLLWLLWDYYRLWWWHYMT